MIRPSALERIKACPASASLSDLVPPSPSGPAAERGTRAHKLLEQLIKTGTVTEKQVMMEEYPLAAWAWERVKFLRQEFGAGCQILSESPVSVPGCPEGGTIDVLFLSQDMTRATIIDLKTGQTRHAADSPQMRGYAVGVQETYGVSECFTIILQADMEEEICCFADAMTLNEWAVELHTIVNNANASNPEVKPSEKACHWCPAVSVCPAHGKVLAPWIPIPNTITARDFVIKASPTEKAGIMESLDAAQRFLDSVRSEMTSAAASGDAPEGWELKSGRVDKVWKDGASVSLADTPEAFEKKLKTPAACIKAGLTVDGLWDSRPSTPSLKRVK